MPEIDFSGPPETRRKDLLVFQTYGSKARVSTGILGENRVMCEVLDVLFIGYDFILN